LPSACCARHWSPWLPQNKKTAWLEIAAVSHTLFTFEFQNPPGRMRWLHDSRAPAQTI
jgi:hypothetical protein